MNMHDTTFRRELPNNIEAEQALLGAIFINNDVMDALPSTLDPRHFFEPIHAETFDVMTEQRKAGRLINPVTIKTLISQGMVGDMTVSQYLAHLAINAVSAVNAPHFAAAVMDCAARRACIALGERMEEVAHSPDGDILDQVDTLRGRFEDVMKTLEGEPDTSHEAAETYLQAITSGRNAESNLGVPIPLKELEVVLSDHLFREKRLIGLLSSSGEGKTSLTMQIVYRALDADHPVLILSYDQTREECVAQMAAQNLGTELRRQLDNLLSQDEVEKCYAFARKIFQKPFDVIDCGEKDTVERLCAKAKRFMKKHRNGKTPLIVIDHIRAIKWDGGPADEGTKALTIGQRLKSLAKDNSAAVLVLQQRSGSGLRRDNPRPIPADLYGGEAARQPFDTIFYLYRAELHMNRQLDTAKDTSDAESIRTRFRQTFGAEVEGKAELGCLKLRFGDPRIKKHVRFDEKLTRYVSEAPAVAQERML
ncbi:helicase DnaB [Ensifer sp. PDNC004]|uniref:replicative DNA helicase n=1 Tax=Ensifer sp. PDNC004 TaxID=2811423 RepID=UPI001962BD91|nr:DnaB-like helicase C-terminal domain-containing protein [Ensifer sp. PDNC004]QRY69191.1 helicase DnaB [Ensifer sp. PDNC004]